MRPLESQGASSYSRSDEVARQDTCYGITDDRRQEMGPGGGVAHLLRDLEVKRDRVHHLQALLAFAGCDIPVEQIPFLLLVAQASAVQE